ncbi:hypothetical protein THTE_3018 [Thermogutta terrifontis]|uniref:Uncharacterized protein n=1 Tax=Thermogutta terrifontis TaxID=1331910 RepID=A0A286RI24_9BACT|nr:hypothetical protein THTE_3018 [Thermogutta terrifontis]
MTLPSNARVAVYELGLPRHEAEQSLICLGKNSCGVSPDPERPPTETRELSC